MKVGLLWHNYPSENLGVGALSFSNIHILDEIFKSLGLSVEYFIVGMMPEGTNQFSSVTKNKVNYFHFSLRGMAKSPGLFFKLRSELSRCKVCFDLSEGDSFTDIYGKKRFLQQAISKISVITTDSPLVLCPQTVGPFSTKWGIAFSNFLMRRMLAIFARDNQSFEYLKVSGHSAISRVTTDLAFALPYKKESYSFDPDKIHVGINVSGLLLNGGYGADGKLGLSLDYKDLVNRTIAYFCARPEVQVHLIAHVISDRYAIEDDYRACEKIQETFPGCVVSPRFSDPVEAKSYISNLDFFTGARMHATIAAISSGVAVVPMAYSRKFNGLFGTLGYNHLVDGKKDDTETAYNKTINYFEQRDLLSNDSAKARDTAKQRLAVYIDYVKGVFGNGR